MGKGYALDWLFKIIKKDYADAGYEGYMVFDADNILDRNYVAEMNKVFDNGYDIPVSYTHLDVYKRQGYYSVRFSLSQEDNTEAFLTGLSDTNVDLVQEEMVNAAIENSQFSMEALDFIDAEKTNLPEDGDDLHCWAATTANMLHYTCLLYTS